MPDWSKQVDGFWLDDSITKVSHHVIERFRENATAGLGTNNLLILAARSVGTIEGLYTFRETSDSYDSNQKDLHLANLDAYLELAKRFASVGDTNSRWKRQRTPRFIVCLTSICLQIAPQLLKEHVEDWIRFLRRNSENQGPDVLASLTKKEHLLHTQIAVSNLLSKRNRSLFWQGDGPSSFMLGICASAVQEGDTLMVAPKVSTPFLVRAIEPLKYRVSNESVLVAKVVSPARVNGWKGGEVWGGAYRPFYKSKEVILQLV